MKILQKWNDFASVYLSPTDTIRVTMDPDDGSKPIVREYTAKQSCKIDTIAMVSLENEFGFKKAIGAVFGESE